MEVGVAVHVSVVVQQAARIAATAHTAGIRAYNPMKHSQSTAFEEKLSRNRHCERSAAISFVESLGKTNENRTYSYHHYGLGTASNNCSRVAVNGPHISQFAGSEAGHYNGGLSRCSDPLLVCRIRDE